MGHQLAGAVVAGAVAGLLVVACGGGEPDAGLPGVLDNAREQVAVGSPEVDAPTASGTDAGREAIGELPGPDPSTFEGANRLVNLWVGVDGDVREVDVWAQRTFSSGPVRLAAGIGFGEVSDYFRSPSGHDLVIVAAGAGPDGAELGEVFATIGEEQLTTVFSNDDRRGGPNAFSVWERGAEQAPAPPAEGRGLVVVVAANLRAFGDDLLASIGGDSFSVGDGSGGCASQRSEGDGFEPNRLGGSQGIELERDPGPAVISLHPWFPTAECGQASVLDVATEVAAGSSTLMVVHTRTGTELDALVVPMR